MATQVRSPAAASVRESAPGWYEAAWRTATTVAVVVFVVIAVLQTPRLPLLAMTCGLALVGGLAVVDAPVGSRRARRQFARGSACVALALLVLVGAGHHLTAALTTLGLLAGTSPWTLHYVAGE